MYNINWSSPVEPQPQVGYSAVSLFIFAFQYKHPCLSPCWTYTFNFVAYVLLLKTLAPTLSVYYPKRCTISTVKWIFLEPYRFYIGLSSQKLTDCRETHLSLQKYPEATPLQESQRATFSQVGWWETKCSIRIFTLHSSWGRQTGGQGKKQTSGISISYCHLLVKGPIGRTLPLLRCIVWNTSELLLCYHVNIQKSKQASQKQ